jgi:hypothetical protein
MPPRCFSTGLAHSCMHQGLPPPDRARLLSVQDKPSQPAGGASKGAAAASAARHARHTTMGRGGRGARIGSEPFWAWSGAGVLATRQLRRASLGEAACG